MGKSKAENFLYFLEQLVIGRMYRTYSDVLANPSCLDIYLENKKETINVWEDVKVLIKKKYPEKSFQVDCMNDIINNRLKWLKGIWKSPFSNAEKKKYIKKFENYSKYFSNEAIEYALSFINMNDFIKVQDCYESMEKYAENKGFMKVGVCKKEKIEKDTYGRKYISNINGTKFFYPDDYQLKEKDFLYNCIIFDYPYMKKYDMKLYHLDAPFEFYINVPSEKGKERTLYIPYSCLKDKSIKVAENRMNEYFRWYYNKDKNILQYHLEVMKSSIFKNLKNDIENR